MVEGGFEAWPALDEIFPMNFQGVQPSRGLDGSVIDTSRDALSNRMCSYFSASTFARACEAVPELSEPRARYDAEKAWRSLKASGHFRDEAIKSFLVFPFDRRFLYYSSDEKWLNEARSVFAENEKDNQFFACVFAPRKASEVYPVYATELLNYHVHERGSTRDTATSLRVRGALWASTSP
jgi:hypothetical protein